MTTLLIIDDEPDLIELLEYVISELFPDLKIETASSVEIAKTKVDLCDIILSDIQMPYMDKLEEMLIASGKPVGRCSGSDPKGKIPFIPKPFTDAQVYSVIQELLVSLGNARRN